jgi:lipoate-protein ligase A
MFDALHVYHDAERRSAPLNMAVDEALLLAATNPTLRFYGWRSPALSFGYFGRFADVQHEESQRELVRRWTGGGIVLHGDDLTYSIIVPRSDAAAAAPPRVLYSAIHDAIRRALGANASATLATADAPKVSDACFANPVRADVILKGRKIAGAAQRRTRLGLLHQGSIQCAALPPDFAEAFASTLCTAAEPRTFAPEVIARAQQIAAEKYATAAWLQRV